MGRYRRSRRAVVALGVLLLTFSLALAAPLVTAYDPLAGSADALLPPLTPGHLGTDHLGRDVWSQLVYGARVSLAVGLLAASSAPPSWGRPWGQCGCAGGWPDGALMRGAEFFQTLLAWCWP